MLLYWINTHVFCIDSLHIIHTLALNPHKPPPPTHTHTTTHRNTPQPPLNMAKLHIAALAALLLLAVGSHARMIQEPVPTTPQPGNPQLLAEDQQVGHGAFRFDYMLYIKNASNTHSPVITGMTMESIWGCGARNQKCSWYGWNTGCTVAPHTVAHKNHTLTVLPPCCSPPPPPHHHSEAVNDPNWMIPNAVSMQGAGTDGTATGLEFLCRFTVAFENPEVCWWVFEGRQFVLGGLLGT